MQPSTSNASWGFDSLWPLWILVMLLSLLFGLDSRHCTWLATAHLMRKIGCCFWHQQSNQLPASLLWIVLCSPSNSPKNQSIDLRKSTWYDNHNTWHTAKPHEGTWRNPRIHLEPPRNQLNSSDFAWSNWGKFKHPKCRAHCLCQVVAGSFLYICVGKLLVCPASQTTWQGGKPCEVRYESSVALLLHDMPNTAGYSFDVETLTGHGSD